MPTYTYPGVYIEEISSGVRTITGVATSITAFVGRALRGPVNEPITITSYGDYERIFGGLRRESTMSYAVRDFYLNGGSLAIIVRLVVSDPDNPNDPNNAATATISLPTGGNPPNILLEAKNPGSWGRNLRVRVEYPNPDDPDGDLYNLRIRDTETGVEERFLGISASANPTRSLDRVLEDSELVRVQPLSETASRPTASAAVDPGVDPFAAEPPTQNYVQATGGEDGGDLGDAQYLGSEMAKEGIYALLKTDLFNLLCIPPINWTTDIGLGVLTDALTLCVKERAMLIVDPRLNWNSVSDVMTDIPTFGLSGINARNAAIFFPRLRMADPQQEGRLETFPPCGAVAGVFARTDAQRGVWKAPAGITDGSLVGVQSLTVPMTDQENGLLNPLGVNCLRAFPVVGRVIWGSRTLRGADQLADEYKYLSVRRMALFLQESLYRGTQWVVFEPNDEPLWAQIRLNIGAFMNNLFRQGAFQGKTPREAYLVKCDSETTTQNDINQGVVNILVGFAPLKPAEFVVIKFQQLAGQISV
jgi:phage tail sheath protein FI